jgi:hypothetical protein
MPLDKIATAEFRATGTVATLHGLSALETEFLGDRRKIVRPCSPAFNRFLRLDAPRDINSDGMRKNPAAAADVAAIMAPINHGGAETFPSDGAWLECVNVNIPTGRALRFFWGFLRFDGFPGNDFCAFQVDDQQPAILKQVIELEIDGNARQTEGPGGVVWLEHRWQPPNNFQGRLRWIVANGQLILNPATTTPSQRRFAWPSAMVLCGLDII